MNIFLDTSSLLKLYHIEPGTAETERIFSENTVKAVFVSAISRAEFSSAVWKKVRTRELNKEQAKEIIEAFATDGNNYTWIDVSDSIIDTARNLITKYGNKGLRTLDGIQLASALLLEEYCQLFVSSDKLLNDFLENEGLKTMQSDVE